MLFTFIVPVYNTSSFLVECINSICKQDYLNFEVILINDGSTDNSNKLCKSLVKRYSCVKYYSKNNEGLGKTRNFGLKKSSGEYIIFVDSDDLFKSNSLNKISEILVECKPDIFVFKNAKLVGNSTKIDKNESFELPKKRKLPNNRKEF